MSLQQGGKRAQITLGILDWYNWSDAGENLSCFYPMKNILDQSKLHGKWAEGLCDLVDVVVEQFHTFSYPIYANHNGLATLHLEYLHCPIKF